jgi:two-component system CheB/CheR fusion protein
VRAGLSVALVDDNPDIISGMSTLLKSLGCQVIAAETAGDGIRLVNELRPHAALIDIGLPDISGYQVAAALRERGYAGLLIAVSGYGHEEARQASQRAGFDRHLAKPAKFEELAALLSEVDEIR